MNFVQILESMPYDGIECMDFTLQSRTVIITFKSGNQLSAKCPENSNQFEILRDTATRKLGANKVYIHDN